MYSLVPGDLNRQVHDVMSGGGKSFWDDPRPYLEPREATRARRRNRTLGQNQTGPRP